MEYNSFIYLWIDKQKNMFYIGSHFGDINDGYLFGGIDIKSEYSKRPEDFERLILSYHTVKSQTEIRKIEREYLVKYDVENDDRFYNRTNESYGGTHKKSIESRLKDIDENGLNAFQRASKKMVETRKSKNSFKSAKIKEYITKKNKIEDFNKIKDKISKALKGRKCINKDGESKYVNPDKYQEHLLDGWTPGIKDTTYETCLNFAKNMNIKSSKKWRELSKLHGLPYNPNLKFKDKWVSWEDFLGKDKMVKSQTYQECKSIALENNIKSQKEWQKLAQNQNLPYNPQRKYKEWVSWYDFLNKK
jgi:hypothetical protein